MTDFSFALAQAQKGTWWWEGGRPPMTQAQRDARAEERRQAVMACIRAAGRPLLMREIMEQADQTKSGITSTLARMVELKMLTRDMTPEGYKWTTAQRD
jgi:hypothetical protein